MPRGRPDYQGVDSRSESVLRQNILFPTGRSIMTDGFESPTNHWNFVMIGAGTINISTDYAMTGDGSLYLATGAAANNYTGAFWGVGLPLSLKTGFEVAIAISAVRTAIFGLEQIRYDGTNAHEGEVRFNEALGYWQYRDDVAAWQTIPNSAMTFAGNPNYWHRFKLTIDVDNDTYLALEVNNYLFDLSAYPLYVFASGTDEYLYSRIYIETDEAAAKEMYVDNIAITEEE